LNDETLAQPFGNFAGGDTKYTCVIAFAPPRVLR
jgi:hypothetical protein